MNQSTIKKSSSQQCAGMWNYISKNRNMITLQGDLFIIMKAMSYTHTLAHEKRVEIHVKMLFSHRKFDVRVCVWICSRSEWMCMCLQTWIQKKTQRNKFYSLYLCCDCALVHDHFKCYRISVSRIVLMRIDTVSLRNVECFLFRFCPHRMDKPFHFISTIFIYFALASRRILWIERCSVAYKERSSHIKTKKV